MTSKELIGSHGEIDVFVVRSTKKEHSALRVEPDHSMLSLELLLWPLEIHIETESMVTSCIRQQDIESDGIRYDELIVDHSLRSIQQNLLFSEFELELLVDDDFVALRKKVDNARILVFVEFFKLGQLEGVDGFLVERIDFGRVMKSSRNNMLKNFRLVDTITWLGEICLRDRSYINQIRRDIT